MAIKITDRVARALIVPHQGNRITYDEEVRGFGLRVTAGGAKSFVLNYRVSGHERRITIGSYPDWSVAAARERARSLKRRVDLGDDPMRERHDERAAPTIADLCYRFEQDYLPKRRPATQRDYQGILDTYVRPKLGRIKVADLAHSDIDALHREVSRRAPYRANRTVAVLSRMMNLAITWGWRTDNPARGIERAPEHKRDRFLSAGEVALLAQALRSHPERISANAILLLLLTGARKNEVLGARWEQFDLESGVWTKPSAHTKQKKDHRVPLSAPASALLIEIKREINRAANRSMNGGTAESSAGPEYVFPGKDGRPLTDVKRIWSSICKRAGLSDIRIHDLRHTYASILASSGLSLPIIGALLGHTQAATTQRYAHLIDDALRQATERVGAAVGGATTGEMAGNSPPSRKTGSETL
jgi:integrase